MKKLALPFVALAVLALGPFAERLGVVVGAALAIVLGVALALAASASWSALSAASGAIGAFAAGVLVPVSPTVAGAVLAGAAFAERTTRVRAPAARLVSLGAAIGGGAIAGSLGSAFAASSIALRGVAVVVSAVLVTLPLVVDADDPEAHALEAASNDLPDPARSTLRRAAELRRGADDALLDREGRALVAKTWRALAKLVDSRLRLESARAVRERAKVPSEIAAHAALVIVKIDERLAKHVDALARAYTAASSASAATTSLDDAALRSIEHVGETLEEVSKAIVDDAA